jgi:hypothetical protein
MVKRASDVRISDNRATLVGPTCGDPVGIRTTSVSREQVHGNDVTGYPSSSERD